MAPSPDEKDRLEPETRQTALKSRDHHTEVLSADKVHGEQQLQIVDLALLSVFTRC